jgi:haloacetate dehalogenase
MAETLFGAGHGLRIAYERVGSGFPILLLHGWPQSRLMWRKVIPLLSDRFTVIAADLRGYGDSDPSDDATSYDKGTMAADMAALMRDISLGERFLVAGHDRGGRVARRMAADYPDQLAGASLLDIMPMDWVFNQGRGGYARRYYHWYFMLARDVSEALISADPGAFARGFFSRSHVPLDPEAVEQYVAHFSRPSTIAASLGDYRTAFEADFPRWERELAEGKRITVPLQLLWGGAGNLQDTPIIEEWFRRATDIRGHAIENSAHYIPEEQPEAVAKALHAFADELGV